ncbi:MAG: type 1 glutamine amidotransferase [Spirochaetia bacterium]|nr:type 1 glutamine amidotransferase [Spirochaetota bacterium]MCX8096450.1 type 1 glutamine amidotransferase [Spirochaetota bacterium]MDW8112746.1 type 1 glutamine amidotransferase [Spirochaetia bacterium]
MLLVLRNSRVEGLGYIENSLRKYTIRFEYFDTDKLTGDYKSFINLDKYSGLIVLGGPQSVYEEYKYPYLSEVKKILDKFITSRKPVLGICLGSQLIANVLGARVYKGDKGEEIGWYDVKITGDGLKDRVFSKYYPNMKVFQWHGDTFDLPRDAVRIATSDNYLNQAFTYNKNVYALQFHIETTLEDAKTWIKLSDFSKEKEESILSNYEQNFEKIKNINDEIVWYLFVNNVW